MERTSFPLMTIGTPRDPGPAASPRAWAAGLRAAIGLALAVPLAIGGCIEHAPQPGGRFALQAAASRLTLTVAPAARTLQYLKSVDWDVAVAELSRAGDAPITLSASAEAAPSADGRARIATLHFPAVAPGPGYRLRVSLRRRDAVGEREVGGGEQADLTLLPGENALALPAAIDPRQPVTVGTVRGLEPYVTSVPGAGLSAALSDAQDVWWASAARCYFLDAGRLGLAYRTADGQTAVRTLAGVDKASGTGLVDGPGAQARFGSTRHMVVAPSGTIYIADAAANAIRRVEVDARGDATVSTVAGGGTPGAADGPGTTATFNNPSDLALDAAGDLYVADTDNHRVRRIDLVTNVITTFAGTGDRTDEIGRASCRERV